MKNYYSTVDNIVLTFSDILEDQNGFESIHFRFERENKSGFDFAEGALPALRFDKLYGFSENEIFDLKEYLRDNSFLIWEIAREETEKNKEMQKIERKVIIVAKIFNQQSCLAYCCKNLTEANYVPNTLECIRHKGVQIVVLDDPAIYSEYAPYNYIEDLLDFINKVAKLNA